MKNNQTRQCALTCMLLLSLAYASCTVHLKGVTATKALSDGPAARETLVNFLANLYAGEYEEAAQLYGGSYETMIDHNPGVNSDDHAALLEHGCKVNGLACLRVNSISPDTGNAGPDFAFQVDFLQEDGTLFVLEACCGGDEADSPSKSTFTFTVRKDARGAFVVMDTPPYAP